MGLFSFWSRPAWKSADPERRLAAVRDLDRPAVLADLARRDADARVRAAATARIDDADVLQDLLTTGDPAVRRIAKERLSSIADRLLRSGTLERCRRLLDSIDDRKSLADLSLHAQDPAVRLAAFARLENAAEPSEGLLALVAVQDGSGELGQRALHRIATRGLLKDIARKAKHTAVRERASAILAERDAVTAGPSREQIRRARAAALEPLVARATRLGVAQDPTAVEAERRTLIADLDACLAAAGAVEVEPEAQVRIARIRRALDEHAARSAAHAAAIAADRAKRLAVLAELEALAGVDAAASAEARSRWEGLGTAPSNAPEDRDLHARYAAQLDRLTAAPAAEAAATASGTAAPVVTAAPALATPELAELDALGAEAEALIEASDRRDARHRFQLLHKRWFQLADRVAFTARERQRFPAAYAAFRERAAQQRAARDQSAAERAQAQETLIAEVIALPPLAEPIAADAARARSVLLKQLQQRWKALSIGRRDRAGEDRRDRFRAALDAVWAPIAQLHEAEDWQRFVHVAPAEALIAEVEALATRSDWPQVLKAITGAQQRWKRLGALPREHDARLWRAFRAACDAQFERLKPWFAEQDAARQASLAAKTAILTEAEALSQAAPVGLAGSPADLQARRASVARMKELQAAWIAAGPAPREADAGLWTRWRAVGDAFWGRHKADLAERDRLLDENRVRKEALCAQTEELARVAATGRATGIVTAADVLRRIRDLQRQWQEVGHVPRAAMEALRARWTAANDAVYAAIKDHTEGLERERAGQLAALEALVVEAETLAQTENARWFKEDVRALQKRWRDLASAPSQEAEALERRFRTACTTVLRAGDAPESRATAGSAS